MCEVQPSRQLNYGQPQEGQDEMLWFIAWIYKGYNQTPAIKQSYYLGPNVDGFRAQLEEHCSSKAKVMGSPGCNCLKLLPNCDDHISHSNNDNVRFKRNQASMGTEAMTFAK